MSESQIVLHCAPTLSGIKPGNLFSTKMNSREELYSQISAMNEALRDKGVCVIPLRAEGGSALIYVYRKSALREYFKDSEVEKLLKKFGYKPESTGGCIAHLRNKIMTTQNFPHEVGLFLGYPAEDVSGFIEHHAKNFKSVGTWKVYGDAEEAQKKFDSFKTCTERCVRLHNRGVSLRQLTRAK